MGSGEIVEAFPLLELGVEELGALDHFAGKEPVEPFVVDAMRPVDLTVQPRRRWSDVDVLNAFVEQVPVETSLELGSIVGLDLHDFEGQLLEDIVDEADRGLLI